ncbi:hypothetical protein MUP77_01185, partial [Candidatus Bathyarchaeota archaeon]|nr:hypothetical protein [Candidatus Bathyarchaeota archaeon]
DPTRFDLAPLVAESEGFSGAELETVVVGALYRAFADEGDLTTDSLMKELAATVPLSVSRREEVESLREKETAKVHSELKGTAQRLYGELLSQLGFPDENIEIT